MGQVLNYCTLIDAETQSRLKQVEDQNEELKQELLTTKKAYVKLQRKHKQDIQRKIDKLTDGNAKITQDLVVYKTDKKLLETKYQDARRRLEYIEDRAQKLEQENKQLRQELEKSVHNDDSKSGAEWENETNESASVLEDPTPRDDMTKLRNWLVFKNLPEKELKLSLIKLLTARNELHRVQIADGYKERYGSELMEDIGNNMKKGNTFELVQGLFQSRAVFDAKCLAELLNTRLPVNIPGPMNSRRKKDTKEDVCEIICCRTRAQLKLISDAYSHFDSLSLKEKLCKLANSNTYTQLIQVMFNFNVAETETQNPMKIAAKVQGNVEYIMDPKVKWKQSENKLKLALIILSNSQTFVKDLSELYYKKTLNNLVDFVDNKIGGKSLTGMFIKTRIEYCADPADFYARKIQIEGDKGWKSEATSINRMFISNFGPELRAIERRFNDWNYGDGWHFIEWIQKKCPGERYTIFLTRMVQNCDKC